MHYFYGVIRGDARKAARLYRAHAELQLMSAGPSPQRFYDHRVIRVHKSYLEGVISGTRKWEPGPTNNVEREEEILKEIQQDTSASVQLERHLTISCSPNITCQRNAPLSHSMDASIITGELSEKSKVL